MASPALSDFHPEDPAFYQGDPDRFFARLRAEDPLHWHETERFWCVTRHADVQEVSRRPRLFSSAQGTQRFEVLQHGNRSEAMREAMSTTAPNRSPSNAPSVGCAWCCSSQRTALLTPTTPTVAWQFSTSAGR